jgi:3-oxoadipate enol-lactonase
MGRWLSAGFKARKSGSLAADSRHRRGDPAAGLYRLRRRDPRRSNGHRACRRISAPTLVLCGSDDPGANPEENRMIAAKVQRGEFLAIEGARHLPNVEDPERFNRIVIDWWQSAFASRTIIAGPPSTCRPW